MSAELRRLLHTAAAESGPLPDVDAIIAQLRRRRRRRVALSASTSVVAVLVAGATLWPGNQQGRVAVGRQSSTCLKSAAPDISRYAPGYLPPGYKDVTPPGAKRPGPAFVTPNARPKVGVISAQTFENWVHFRLNLEVRRVSEVGSFRNGEEASTRRISKGRMSSFVLPCKGRVSIWTDDASRDPVSPQWRRITYLVLPLDANTEAVLTAEPPTPNAVGPPVVQLVKMAQSVAVP
jgi:hypothetical protein